ncbi:hypothetical protein POPTR_005G134875v4 [Populus trichocarpa]|uniref:Uncharacterized protein n=1 Tax=Populus trichocarpa TaxID=3694 RepID=A0ACC0SZN2_POPTR|nr:hypothetical protein BDE02_05G114700 [Populus trichocarpa]KAI9394732.1 hypothetical protein POPTR_005G134875v4 [Populus trichocarpa]
MKQKVLFIFDEGNVSLTVKKHFFQLTFCSRSYFWLSTAFKLHYPICERVPVPQITKEPIHKCRKDYFSDKHAHRHKQQTKNSTHK